MSDTFYHIDREDALTPGQTIELAPVSKHESGVGSPLADLYPAGLSHHGQHYCEQDLYTEESEELWDFSCELVFEMTRIARFSDRPSRFQSVFGFETLRDAEYFVDEFADSPCTIWRVTAERSFSGDMRLVDAEDYADGVRRARHYWRGETFLDDPLWEVLLVPPVEVVELVETNPSA